MPRVRAQSGSQQLPVPRIRRALLPCAAAHLTEPLGGDVENRRLCVRGIAELAAADSADPAVVAEENARRVEDRDTELPLELAERPEHPIDRATRLLALLVGGDDQKAAVEQLARTADRNPVRRPLVEKRVDAAQHNLLRVFVERRGDAEDPDVRVAAELIDVGPHGESLNHRRGAVNFSLAGSRDTLGSVSIAKILDMLSGRSSEAQPAQQHDPLRLATAAVLLDIAYADGEFTPSEDGDVVGFLSRRFDLSPEDAQELLEAADEIRKKTVDHFALTHYIRKNSPLDERIEMVKAMWRLVYSDGVLTNYEGYLVRKVADLMGLEHHVMIDAKSTVLRELGMSAT